MNPQFAILKLQQVLRRKHLALATEQAYVHWLKHYMASLKTVPHHLSSTAKVESFLSNLAAQRDISTSTQHQAFNAILFFYTHVLEKPLQNVDALRVSRLARIRNAPSLSDTQALLQAVPNLAGYPTRLLARLLYGCGLRVSEPLNLRIKDIRLDKHALCIRGAKGGKDRIVPLPASLLPEIKQQIYLAHAVWQQDCQNNIPLFLPQRLGRKYREFQFAWPWAWFLPGSRPIRHYSTGQLVRYRMHEVNLQRAIKIARQKLGLAVLPHELRHGYATHCLERGVNPRAIQQVMGHKSLETTMGYLHAESLSVPSPLEATESLQLPLDSGLRPGHFAPKEAHPLQPA